MPKVDISTRKTMTFTFTEDEVHKILTEKAQAKVPFLRVDRPIVEATTLEDGGVEVVFSSLIIEENVGK